MGLVITGENSAEQLNTILKLDRLHVFPSDMGEVKYTAAMLNEYWTTKYPDYLKYSGASRLSSSDFSATYGVRAQLPVTLKISSGSTIDTIISTMAKSFTNYNFSLVHLTNLPQPKRIEMRVRSVDLTGYYVQCGLMFKAMSGDQTVSTPVFFYVGTNKTGDTSSAIRIDNNRYKLPIDRNPDEILVLTEDDFVNCFQEKETEKYEMIIAGCNKIYMTSTGNQYQPYWRELNLFF